MQVCGARAVQSASVRPSGILFGYGVRRKTTRIAERARVRGEKVSFSSALREAEQALDGVDVSDSSLALAVRSDGTFVMNAGHADKMIPDPRPAPSEMTPGRRRPTHRGPPKGNLRELLLAATFIASLLATGAIAAANAL